MSSKLQENNGYKKDYHTIDQNVFDVSKWGTRHKQCVLLFFILTIAYSMRSCMGVALVAMAQHAGASAANASALGATAVANDSILGATLAVNGSILGATLAANGSDELQIKGFFNVLLLSPPYPKFKWSKKVQDTVISAFFWGYMALQVPGGHLSYKFGSRYLLFGALMSNCVLALIFPIGSYYGGWIFALVCRMGQGLSQACILPSFHTMLGKWSPLEERGRMSAIIYGGQALGTVLGLPITGFIASSPILGWPGIFRFYGIMSGIIAVVVWFFLADSPAVHKTISVAERRYIEESLRQKSDNKKQLAVPWRSILSSRAMLAIVVAHVGSTWGQVILYSEVPAYMDQVMGVNIKANGLLTALPFFVMFFFNFFFSWLSDMMIVKKYFSITHTRKIANCIAYVPAAIGFIALAYAPQNIYVVESILVIICCFKVAGHVGFHVNHIDISPNFAGVMMGISNFSANAVSSFAPIIAGLVLTDPTDKDLWKIVFFIAAGLYLFTNTVYLLLGTAEPADWNEPAEYARVAAGDDALENEPDSIMETGAVNSGYKDGTSAYEDSENIKMMKM
ncbi:putative inorganic phosphate cotransporter [Ostrinia nubilalis]|uniref:putative inorganic phosphate cotransporter n=1 Tax=Ostrinia nubilalis TaxID=29057 RepID=UPI00308269F4